MQAQYPDLRVVTVVKNRGKAHGYNVAIAYAKGDFILSNDADTKPNPDAVWQYMSYFEREGGHNVGAVTGNMLAANRTTSAQSQQNEFNSIIGLIKRSQMSYGALFAFSGANTMYRKQAVLDVGGGTPSSRPRTSPSHGTCRRRAGVRCSRPTSASSSTSPSRRGRWSSNGDAGHRVASTSW